MNSKRALLVLPLFLACGNFTTDPMEPATIEFSQKDSKVSDCNGFALRAAPTNYCDAEMLYWEYDAAQQRLKLDNTRVNLNCCGIHDMRIEQANGVYVATESDTTSSAVGRCRCMCVFDFQVAAEGVPNQQIQLRVVREILENATPDLVFEGAIDLAQGSGSITIDQSPVMDCTN